MCEEPIANTFRKAGYKCDCPPEEHTETQRRDHEFEQRVFGECPTCKDTENLPRISPDKERQYEQMDEYEIRQGMLAARQRDCELSGNCRQDVPGYSGGPAPRPGMGTKTTPNGTPILKHIAPRNNPTKKLIEELALEGML